MTALPHILRQVTNSQVESTDALEYEKSKLTNSHISTAAIQVKFILNYIHENTPQHFFQKQLEQIFKQEQMVSVKYAKLHQVQWHFRTDTRTVK